MGYLLSKDEKPPSFTELRGKLPNQSGAIPMSFIDRLHNEKSELHHKLTALEKFIASDDYRKLDISQQILMGQQSGHMAYYHYVLGLRLALLEAPAEPPVTSEYFPIDELRETGEFDDRPLDFKG